MDFLNVPTNEVLFTQPSAIRHPDSVRAFRDIRVPKLLVIERNIKKLSFSYAMTTRNYFADLHAPGFTAYA